MNRMITLFSLAALAGTLALSDAAWSQRRGGGSSQQGSQGSGVAQKGGTGGQQADRGSRSDQTRDRQRVHLSQEQHASYTKAAELATAARSQARGMAGGTRRPGFGPELAARERDALGGQIHGMFAEHDRMMQGISAADRVRLGDRLQKLDRVHDRMMTHLAALDRECAGPRVDASRFARRSRDLEQDLKAWTKHHGKLGVAAEPR